MFAHQVIEDFKKQENGVFKEYSFWIRYCGDLLKSAHCFHMGEVSDVHRAFESQHGKQLFIENAKYIRLPYKTCWFDATTTKGDQYEILNNGDERITKEGVLVAKALKDSDKFLIVFIISYSKSHRSWILIPISYIISVGENFTQESCDFLTDALKIPRGKCDGNGNVKVLLLHKYFPLDQVEKQHSQCHLNLQLLQEALLLLNCKNITTETHEAPSALNKARRNKGKQELFSYKTLKLIVPQDKQDCHSKGGISLDHNRIHFCRGHFKEYTADAPLFGKITGLWWWQAHVRGQNRDGIVMKDYKATARAI